MNKIKQLEIKKLIKELDFIESDLAYKSEIIQEADNNFMKSVNELLGQHPQLKDIFDKKINDKIENVFKKKIEEIKKEEADDIVEVKRIFNKKAQKLYRQIAKLTHPDITSNKKLNNLYIKATRYYHDNDITGTYSVCDELDIEYEIDESDNEVIIEKINKMKERISFIENNVTWVWFHLTDEKEKEQILLKYISSQIR